MIDPRPSLDVSHLPPIAFDKRAPSWWGNTLFMTIETTSVLLLLMSYYYTKQNFPQWPPPRSDDPSQSFDVLPGLGIATWNLALLLSSIPVAFSIDRAARRGDSSAARRNLALLSAIGVLATVLRFYELTSLKFRWDDNAYASLTWAIVVVHLIDLIVGVVEFLVTGMWILLYGMSEGLADDLTLTAIYWYWMVGIWVPLYATVYWAPRFL